MRPFPAIAFLFAPVIAASCAPAPAAPVASSVVIAPAVSGSAPAPVASARALPRASSPVAPMDADTLTIDLAASGAIFANGEEMAGEKQLRQVARSTLARQPEVRAVIRADGSVAYGKVIGMLDLLKEEGITRVAFAVASAP